jgi:hypothetical protein
MVFEHYLNLKSAKSFRTEKGKKRDINRHEGVKDLL